VLGYTRYYLLVFAMFFQLGFRCCVGLDMAGDCKRVRKHVASRLGFKVLEAEPDKLLRLYRLVGSIVTAFLVGKKA
jgi:hypothetical protein